MNKPVTLMREANPEPLLNATPWKRIEGTNPQTITMVSSQSPDGRKITGVWICTPGKWEIDYDRWEYCHFHEGHSIITPEGSDAIHLKAGDIFTIEPGTKGTWEVVETVRKNFIFVS
ncbi:cupin domain-containing protein [Allopusillimonas ginsengisoli]|uniref:cupin domain-containing protein n=1 Tax=Allopusillimonas ginsengisoli TaxID=453575 RepID=UPI0010202108|nr:cupin domain-containing protein [Allopusillimonas ginsengisoli]TEA72264.1 cupin domain-containing protein [Allopusillimonas ginsengisoli]